MSRFVLHVDTAATWRGGQNQVLLTAAAMAARGTEVAIACRAGGELQARAVAAGARVSPLPFRGDLWPPAILALGNVAFGEAVDAYREQAEALAEGGVDLFAVETMPSLDQARAAVTAVRAVSALPVMVSLTFNDEGTTFYGDKPEDIVRALDVCRRRALVETFAFASPGSIAADPPVPNPPAPPWPQRGGSSRRRKPRMLTSSWLCSSLIRLTTSPSDARVSAPRWRRVSSSSFSRHSITIRPMVARLLPKISPMRAMLRPSTR